MFRMANVRRQFHHRGDGEDLADRAERIPGRQADGQLSADETHQVGEPDSRAELDPVPSDRRRKPLIGSDEETLAASESNFAVSIVGFDETSGQTVHARDLFAAQDVRFGQEYEDIIWIDGHWLRRLDYSTIDSI